VTVAAVVLAAGASRRLGRPKQEILIASESLLQRTVRLARDASLSPVIVVTREGAEYGEVVRSDGSVILATNYEVDEGLASSIRCGISLASNHDVVGAVILTCDQPALRAAHLRALAEDISRVTGSAYAGSVGVPAYFPAASFPLLLQLRGDTGARKLLINAHAHSAEELRLDIDTDQDLAAARALLELNEKRSQCE
jgi:CTP:molybdopterin cytidylyltransferase MocA